MAIYIYEMTRQIDRQTARQTVIFFDYFGNCKLLKFYFNIKSREKFPDDKVCQYDVTVVTNNKNYIPSSVTDCSATCPVVVFLEVYIPILIGNFKY